MKESEGKKEVNFTHFHLRQPKYEKGFSFMLKPNHAVFSLFFSHNNILVTEYTERNS